MFNFSTEELTIIALLLDEDDNPSLLARKTEGEYYTLYVPSFNGRRRKISAILSNGFRDVWNDFEKNWAKNQLYSKNC